MPTAKKRASNGGRATKGSAKQQNAVELLKSDHREVEHLFEQFEKAKSTQKKADLAQQICRSLRTHTTIEEEIFYPAFLEATRDEELHNEAQVEHAGAKKLIAEIEEASPGDEYYDAKVTVLSEMIKHHVNEEEQPRGMFAEARQSDMNLQALGEQLRIRKLELQTGDHGARPSRRESSQLPDQLDRMQH